MTEFNRTIGEIVAEDYRTAEVFESHGIDFCCGGNITLQTICRDKDLDLVVLKEELKAVKSEPAERSQDFAAWEISFLIDYIVNVHHGYLKDTLDKTNGYAQKIAQVHGTNHPEVIEIAAIFHKIADELKTHLKEEEEIFFPVVKRIETNKKSGSTPTAEDIATLQESLKKLQIEHEEVGDAIHKIRHLAGDYAIPDNVCNTFALTYQKLKEFEDDLHKHVHLENNILFTKAGQF